MKTAAGKDIICLQPDRAQVGYQKVGHQQDIISEGSRICMISEG